MTKRIRKCSIPGCDGNVSRRGMCNKHYRKELRANSPICSIGGCKGKQVARGWCNIHYRRWERNGSPHIGTRHYGTPEESFAARSIQRSNGCTEWTGWINNNGYGTISVEGKDFYAHRYSWQRANGEIPDGMVIDHICRNSKCVKVEHLRVVTQKQNMENHSGASRISKSGVRGVHWSTAANKWVVQVTHNGETNHGGVYSLLEEAEQAAIALRKALHSHNDLDRIA